jgi:broad specificity phosphatase PhoE
MKVIFVRHGEITSNTLHIYSGRSQEPLNANGIIQAKKVAEKLASEGISHLFCSPLLRAAETAKFIAVKSGLEPVMREAFNEIAMGPWEGMSESDVAKRYPNEWRIWSKTPEALILPGRETLAQLQERIIVGLSEVFKKSVNAQKICVVSHVAVIRVALLFAEQRCLNDYKQVSVPNATPISLDIDENKLR